MVAHATCFSLGAERVAFHPRQMITAHFPPVLAVDETVLKNPVQQIASAPSRVTGSAAKYSAGRAVGHQFQPSGGGSAILIVDKAPSSSSSVNTHVLVGKYSVTASELDCRGARWLRHPHLSGAQKSRDDLLTNVAASWTGAYAYQEAAPDGSVPGLRAPQLGALHAVQAHWTVSDRVATIVLPTGTGKTETMIAVVLVCGCEKVLVVAPTDALRTQLTAKFLSLGHLRAAVSERALNPVVCAIEHRMRTPGEVDRVFASANVFVTTGNLLGGCSEAVRERIAHHCSHLFIDEAHHAEARTWSMLKASFAKRRVLQFTATPFREDGTPLDGRIIFKYSLRKAQQEGYFKPIRFEGIFEFDPQQADEQIATKAIEQLRADLERGHILMARVSSISRAEAVFKIYERFPEFHPVLLHSKLSEKEGARRKALVMSGHSRVVVCVDMLGEGFDLPELKIAAFHDIRKSLATTLQLAGRFTRSNPKLGQATFIANIANIDVREELRRLYSMDPDWNVLLPSLSEHAIGEQLSFEGFVRGFGEPADAVPLRSIRPAFSTVVYRTSAQTWSPYEMLSALQGRRPEDRTTWAVNEEMKTAVCVSATRASLLWIDAEALTYWQWDLHVAIWDPEQGLLFIHSSENEGVFKKIAEAIVGPDVALISGSDVFRAFHDVKRLRLKSVGLKEFLGGNLRYTQRMGPDVDAATTEVQRQRAQRAVLAGIGFQDGKKTSLGVSRKGRIWSRQRGHLNQLHDWCRAVGRLLKDTTIDSEAVLAGTLESKWIDSRPDLLPIVVDWPDAWYLRSEEDWRVTVDGKECGAWQLSLELVAPSHNGPLTFAIVGHESNPRLEFELVLAKDERGPRFETRGSTANVVIAAGKKTKSAEEFFDEEPPVFFFTDGSSLEGNQFTVPKAVRPPYDANRIVAWDWSGVDIRKESQGEEKARDSIQAHVIAKLVEGGYDLIYDDDGAGESADVVAIKLHGGHAMPSNIEVELHHCKYAHGDLPGRRVNDLYELCGQVQKSIHWASSHEKRVELFSHLLRRDAQRTRQGRPSRLEVGTRELLVKMREMARMCTVTIRVFAIQPGLSKKGASLDQLRLLSVTDSYLSDTYQLDFRIIASD